MGNDNKESYDAERDKNYHKNDRVPLCEVGLTVPCEKTNGKCTGRDHEYAGRDEHLLLAVAVEKMGFILFRAIDHSHITLDLDSGV